LLLCVVVAQVKPKIPDVFTSQVTIRYDTPNSSYAGDGVIASNQPIGEAVEHYRFPRDDLTEYFLQRYDLGYAYHVDNLTTCSKAKVDGKLPGFFDWVQNSTYVARTVIDRLSIDIWEYKTGYSTLDIGVLTADTNHPVWYWRYNNQRNSTIHFDQFNAQIPSPFYFNVPEECNREMIVEKPVVSAPQSECETRANIIARAKVWVDNKVPYNQGATYQGYREDCSGFVSMAWALSKPGLVTQTLGSVSTKITKDQLMEGDILLYAAEHVVLFGGWTNTAKTEYTAYEETKPGEGTVSRATPYPYWYDTADFLPYKYNSVC